MHNKRIQALSHSFQINMHSIKCSAVQKEFVFKKTQNEMSPKLILNRDLCIWARHENAPRLLHCFCAFISH